MTAEPFDTVAGIRTTGRLRWWTRPIVVRGTEVGFSQRIRDVLRIALGYQFSHRTQIAVLGTPVLFTPKHAPSDRLYVL